MDSDIREILGRINDNDLINLLPSWQRDYFYHESNKVDKSFLIKYISESANELITHPIQLAFLILQMTDDEFEGVFTGSTVAKKYKSRMDLLKHLKTGECKKTDVLLIKNRLGIKLEKTDTETYKPSIVSSEENRFYELLDYQVYVKEQILNTISSDQKISKVVVHMPTGTGKTKTSMHTITDFFINSMEKIGLVLWVAHTNTLLEQAEETFVEVWKKLGAGDIGVFRLYDDNNGDDLESTSNGIVFMGIQKLISITKNNQELFTKIRNVARLVIFDEAHKSTASETKKAINSLLKRGQLTNRIGFIGLTATPGRNSGSDIDNDELAELYDRNLISIDPQVIEQLRKNKLQALNQEFSQSDVIHYFQDRRILSRLVKEEIDYDTSAINELLIRTKIRSGADDVSNEIINHFAYNLDRNRKIIEKLMELDRTKTQTIFFSCSVEHGRFITSLLKANGVAVREIYGDTTSSDRREIIKGFKNGEFKILVNCGVLTTGFDSTNIRCVFIARPTTSIVLYSQMVGRGLRGPKMGGGEYCTLIDMKDNLSRFTNENQIFQYFKDYWR